MVLVGLLHFSNKIQGQWPFVRPTKGLLTTPFSRLSFMSTICEDPVDDKVEDGGSQRDEDEDRIHLEGPNVSEDEVKEAKLSAQTATSKAFIE